MGVGRTTVNVYMGLMKKLTRNGGGWKEMEGVGKKWKGLENGGGWKENKKWMGLESIPQMEESKWSG